MSKIKCIIICAGDGTRWDNYLGSPKHLIKIGGERLIDRVVKQLNKYNTEVYVIAKNNDDRYKVEGSTYYEADLNENNVDADKFLSSQELWSKEGRTIVFYGDVWFTDEAIKTIIEYDKKEWILFSNMVECFAQSFYPENIEEHLQALYKIRDAYKEKRIERCGGWEHYRAMTGIPLTEHRFNGRNYQITDLTDDFDYPKDYEVFIKKYEEQYGKDSVCM